MHEQISPASTARQDAYDGLTFLGWRWGLPINVGFSLVLAFWPLPAIVISTTSVLVAARNFQSAWLMRSLGEQVYRDWHVERIPAADLQKDADHYFNFLVP